MPPIQAPTPTAPSSSVRTDTRVNESDEQRNADLRKRIEQRLPMVEDARIVHDATLNSQPSERNHERTRRHYEESMNAHPRLAEEEAEGDNNPRRSHMRVKGPSRQRHPSTSVLVEDIDDEDNDSRTHSVWHGSQPYPPRRAPRDPSPGSQARALRPVPLPSELSSIRALVHANGQIYSARFVLFQRCRNINSTDTPSSSAGPHHAESLNSDQPRRSNLASRDTERHPVQNHDLIVSHRERPNPSPAGPHGRSTPSTYPTVLLRSIADGIIPSNDDTRQGVAIPCKHTNPEGPRGSSWGSLRRPSFDDSNALRCLIRKGDPTLPPVLSDTPDIIHGQLDDQQGTHSLRSRRSVCNVQSINPEQIAACWETEAAAQKKEAEAKRNEAEAKMREAEAKRKLEAAQQRELEARRNEEEAKRIEEDAIKQEEEVQRKEEGARRREKDAQKMLEDARQQETLARQVEENARRFEENVRNEVEARKEDKEKRRKEDELREMEEERKEHHLAQEATTRQASGSSRHERKVAAREAEDAVRLGVTKAYAANRSANVESAAAEEKKQLKAQGRAQAKRQEEQQRLEEEQFPEEERRRKQEMLQREQEEQTRLDEELRRIKLARLDREALLEQEHLLAEAQEIEIKRLQEKQRRAVEEKWHWRLEEQRRKIPDQSRQDDQPYRQQRRHKDEILSQHAKEQQQEFERRDRTPYDRTTEPERRNNMGQSLDSSVPHPPAGSRSGVVPAPSSSAGSTWSVRPSHNTSASSSMAFSAALKPSLASTRPVARQLPGTGVSRSEEEKWAQRAEERAREQQEQFKREQERLEGERQVKTAKVLPEKRPTDYTKATGRSGNSSRTATAPQHGLSSTVRPSQRR